MPDVLRSVPGGELVDQQQSLRVPASIRRLVLRVLLSSVVRRFVITGSAACAVPAPGGGSASDPVTFVAATCFLALAAIAACYIPARRAAAINPASALRYD